MKSIWWKVRQKIKKHQTGDQQNLQTIMQTMCTLLNIFFKSSKLGYIYLELKHIIILSSLWTIFKTA